MRLISAVQPAPAQISAHSVTGSAQDILHVAANMCFGLTLDLNHGTVGLVGSARSSTLVGHLILGRSGQFCRSARVGLLFSGPTWCSSVQRQTAGRIFSLPIAVAMIATATMSLRIAGPMVLNRLPARKSGKEFSNFTKGTEAVKGSFRTLVIQESLFHLQIFCSWYHSSPPRTFGGGLHAKEEPVSGNVKRRAIVAPTAV